MAALDEPDKIAPKKFQNFSASGFIRAFEHQLLKEIKNWKFFWPKIFIFWAFSAEKQPFLKKFFACGEVF